MGEFTISQVGRDGEGALLVTTHADETLVPAANDLSDTHCPWINQD